MSKVTPLETPRRLLDGSCRVAFAAYLHDIGKLAQRAEVFDRDPRREINQQLYCPQWNAGTPAAYFTHLHAADTALALDALEPHLPLLKGVDPFPFAASGEADVTDSLINAAAAHHRPATFLQWCIAAADRIASGFEREDFEEGYNRARDRDDYKTVRMLVALEEYRGVDAGREVARHEQALNWRYPLRPLSPNALMPVAGAKPDIATAVAEYRRLWDLLLPGSLEGNSGVGLIPKSHRENWGLWLDHFDSLWATVAHAIPAATAGNTRPDVSLYDHSRTTAALAVALWRYHHDLGHDPNEVASAQRHREDWEETKFLLVQADFSGIQSFIFGGNATVQKKAAKLLRGRSAMVSLLGEVAALKILDALALPSTSIVINAAGKLLLVAPNSPGVCEALATVRQELDGWFREQAFGLASMAIAATAASPNDFISSERFDAVRSRLVQALDRAKRHALGLCSALAGDPVLNADYADGACSYDSRLPAGAGLEEDGEPAHPLSAACIRLGDALANQRDARLLILRGAERKGEPAWLPIDLFGYDVRLALSREIDGNFGEQARSGALRRAFDFSLPGGDLDAVAWSGYARRPLASHVPLHLHDPAQDPRYAGMDANALGRPGDLKTFEHLARDNRTSPKGEFEEAAGRLVGVEALGVLKGDIDDLGALFDGMLKRRPSFAAWAELSRRVNAYFSIRVPAKLEADPELRNVYTVFAGGDDFLFIGPWRTVRRLAHSLQQDFEAYVGRNPHVHFSAGYAMAKPGQPIRQLVAAAEAALEQAKARDGGTSGDRKNALGLFGTVIDPGRNDRNWFPGKNALGLFGTVIAWAEWPAVEELRAAIDQHVGEDALSNQYLYGLLGLARMAADQSRPEHARWRARLHYQTRRFVEEQRQNGQPMGMGRAELLIQALGDKGLARRPDALCTILYEHIYSLRD